MEFGLDWLTQLQHCLNQLFLRRKKRELCEIKCNLKGLTVDWCELLTGVGVSVRQQRVFELGGLCVCVRARAATHPPSTHSSPFNAATDLSLFTQQISEVISEQPTHTLTPRCTAALAKTTGKKKKKKSVPLFVPLLIYLFIHSINKTQHGAGSLMERYGIK